MHYIVLAILFIFSGFFMKYSDDLYDENHNLALASFCGIVCGIVSGIASTGDIGAAYIFISILVGNLIVLKVDGLHHILSSISFFIICIIFGIPDLNIIVLLICILTCIADEVCHELFADNQNSFLSLFFEYRFLMKIVVFLLAIFNVFDISVFIYFMLFEISYAMAGFVFKKLN